MKSKVASPISRLNKVSRDFNGRTKNIPPDSRLQSEGKCLPQPFLHRLPRSNIPSNDTSSTFGTYISILRPSSCDIDVAACACTDISNLFQHIEVKIGDRIFRIHLISLASQFQDFSKLSMTRSRFSIFTTPEINSDSTEPTTSGCITMDSTRNIKDIIGRIDN